MVLTRAGHAQLAAEAASIQRLPEEVLLNVLTYIESPADMSSFLQTSKTAREFASDPHLMAQWLMMHRCDDAMRLAAHRPHQGDVVMLHLLRLGASATSCSGSPSPVHLAVKFGYPEVVDHLMGRPDVLADTAALHGAFLAAIVCNNLGCMQAFLGPHSPLSANAILQLPGKRHPLCIAAFYANLEAVRLLLSHDAQCAHAQAGWAALHYACYRNGSKGDALRIEVVRCLLERDCSVIDFQDLSYAGETPLMLAARTDFPEGCAVLLQAGSQSLHIRDRSGRTPLDRLLDYKKEVQEVLLRFVNNA